MQEITKTKDQLIYESLVLRKRVDELRSAELECRRAEDALRESEKRYRALAESAHDFIFILNVNGRLEYVNSYCANEFNCKPGDLIGKDINELFPQESEERAKRVKKIFKTGESLYIEEKFFFPTRKLWLDTWLTPIKDEEGNVKSVMGISRDITERRRAIESAQDKERFLLNIFSSIQDGVSVLDKNMNIIRVNAAMEKWYKHAMPLVGKKCYEAYHLRDQRCEICPTYKTLKTGKPACEEVPKIGGKGKLAGWIELYSFPLVDTESGELTGVIEYVRDITERKRAEQKEEGLKKELLASNKRLKQLTLKDPHTGLYNHRYLAEVIEAEFHRARREAHPLSMIMLDIDYFKSINDLYGHQFGDMILKQFATQLKGIVRSYDTVIRYGGEEFVIISPGVNKHKAIVQANRYLDMLNSYNFGNGKHGIKLKLSMSVVSYPDDIIAKSTDFIDLSDKILNKAKEKGGNRVYSAGDINGNGKIILKDKVDNSSDAKFLRDKITKLTKRGNQSIIEAIVAFAKTIELKDHDTGEHVEKTVHYVTQIASAMGLPEEDIESAKEAAVLHDLGKIGISEKILLKPSKLTKKEFEEIKKHPQIGADIIRPIHFMHDIIPLILYHHERWDGKGYPAGLAGEEIPIGARIIAIADVYHALNSARPYRKAYSKKEAIDIIKKGAGSHFDPKIVSVFLGILKHEKQ